MAGSRIEEGKTVFYKSEGNGHDYAVVLFPGFGRSPTFYHHLGKLWSDDGHTTVIPEWDGNSRFSEKDIIDSVYEPADSLRNDHAFKHVVGIGHSFGAERLLKAALLDTEDRYSAIALVQPPERLGKYVNNHSRLYNFSKHPVTRALALGFLKFRKKDYHVRNLDDQRRLLSLIDNDSSVMEYINRTQLYSTPTRFIYSPADRHVSHEDALRMQKGLSEKSSSTDTVGLAELSKQLTIEQMQEVYEFAKSFFDDIFRAKEEVPHLQQEPGIA